MKLFTNMTRPFVLFVLLFTMGVGQMWGDTWLFGSFQSWVAKDDSYKFSYDGDIGTYYLELNAATEYEFKIIDGDNYYSMNNANYTTTTTDQLIYTGNGNCKVTTGEAGVYVFKTWWADNNRHFSIYFPQARLTKQKYVYFDARNETNWNSANFNARFWFKYYDSGENVGPVTCNKENALDNWVYYALVPDNDYVGRIQMNRINPNYPGEGQQEIWCTANVAWAKDRSSSALNCLKEEEGKADYCNSWTPQWTTYCPPISSVTMTDNGSTLYGGNGSAGTPYLIEAGDPIKVHVTEAVSAVNDGNMTVNYQFKDGASNIGDEGTTSSATKTSGSSGTTHTIIVEARNKYNGAAGTLAKCTLYYETKTVYTGLSVAKSGDDSKASSPTISQTWAIATNSVTVTATVPDGYRFTGWTSSNGSFGDASALSTTFTPTADDAVATANYALRWAIATSYDSWSTDNHIIGNISTSAGVTSGYVDITLPANTDYELKVFDKTNHWLGHTTSGVTLTYSNSGTKYAMAEGNYNLGFTTAGAGSYRFTWDITNSKVSVTYPTSYYVTAAGNPAAGGTVTPSSATYMSTSVGGEITATPNYSHYFNGWTSSAGGTFTSASSATTTFKPASAAATVTAAFPERTAFIEGNFQIYNSTRATRTKTGDSWQDASTAIKMTYDSENNRYYLHTYSTPAELAEQLNSADAYFYVKTSTSSSSIADAATYKAYSSAVQSLTAYGASNKKATGNTEHSFKFTGSEDGYVILYFNGTHVWYELECALSYYGGDGATGDAPAARTYYAYNATPKAASNTYSKTGYTFDHWDTAADDSGTDYDPNDDVTMNAHEVCLHAQWTAKDYTINLANMEATIPGTTSVDVTFDASTNMTASDPITKPTKTHYDFGGYWTSENTGATLGHQLIGADGKWIKDVEGYTSHDGSGNPTWVHDYAISLYAKWTEHEYAVTLAISPAGAGTTSPASSTTAKYVTASGDITATPNTGYSFREWDFSKTATVPDIYCADGYSSISNPVNIHAVHDGTLTANFTPNEYTVSFENLGADAGHKGSLDTTVTFNDTIHMKGRIEVPSKTNYDFGGYYISTDRGATLTNIQIIDANGNWNKNISGYTGTKDNVASWVCAGDTTLYAKWTETAYTITPSVSPAGAGSVNTVTDAHLVTPSSDITATPAKAVWVFDHWTCGTNVGIAGGKGTGDNPVTVTASQNSTITAYFKHRYNLLGSKYESDKEKTSMATGGMPGWTYGSGADFTINSYTVDGDNATVNLSYTCTLEAGTYIFEIHDRELGESLGRKGDGGAVYALTDGSSVQLRGGTDKDQSIFFYPQHAGQYTFRITYMTKDGNYYYPTVTIERPHQLHFGTGYAGIDNLSSVTSGTTGGTLAVTTSAGSLSNEDWVTYGTDVTYTPSAATGYTFEGFYTSNTYSSRFTQDNPWVHYNVTSDDNVYAKFEEKSTSVTLANDGNGKVQISSTDKTSTTCGVTTTRELTAVPSDGYKFSSWTKTSGDDITISSTSTNPTTLRGQGAGATSGQTVTANFTYRWALKAESAGWGSSEFIIGNISTDAVSGDVVGYVEITLAANTNYEFTMKDLLTNDIYKNNNTAVQYMTYTNYTDWGFATDYTFNCGITTAGRGTYRFTWNVTDKTMTVTYPTSYLVNLGVKSVTYEGVEGSLGTVTATDAASNNYTNGQYIANGETVTITATPADDYDFVGWWNSSEYSGDHFATANPTSWTVSGAVNAYAKFTEKSNTFTATSGSNWNTTANWSAGHVPTIHEVAVINEPVIVDIAHAVANRIVLDQNSKTGKLTIQPNKGLEVAGTITRTTDGSDRLATREEDLVLESSSAGNASLIFDNSNSCKATVQMYSIGDIVDANTWNWQFMGTPFTSANALYSYYGSYLYEWKAGGYWDAVANGGTMTPFTGYCITQDEPTYYVMDGTLNPTTSKTLTVPAGVEMVFANSWSAPIDIGTFTDDAFGITTKTVYLFNTGFAPNKGDATEGTGTAAGTYIVVPIHASPYTGNELIAPMQGFYVDNTGKSAGTITMDYATVVRPTRDRNIVAGPMRAPKRVAAENEPAVMKIKATGSRYSEWIVILEREDFSAGFDNGWDGKNLNEPGVAPILYALREDGTKDAVSAIPTYEGTVVGFRIGEDNNYTFSFNYDGEDIWYLNDLKEEKSTLIDAANTYSFVAEAGDAEARFIISATPIAKLPTGIDNDANDANDGMVKVRKLIINDQLYIIRAGRMYNAVGSIVK